jgi:PEP-CTERM motif
MNNNLRKISPFGLGVALFCYQLVQQPMVRAASLGSNDGSDLTSLAPSIPVDAPSATGTASSGCPLNLLNTTPQKGGVVPSQGSAASSGLGYQSETIAQSDGVKVAQLVPDENCCELGGTVDCELGGIAPAGGAAAAGFPFAALAGLLPIAAVPLAFGGGDNNDSSPAVPEPSSTAGLVAGFGMLGIWFSRRFRRSGQKPSA